MHVHARIFLLGGLVSIENKGAKILIPKLDVAGSIPVARSKSRLYLNCTGRGSPTVVVNGDGVFRSTKMGQGEVCSVRLDTQVRLSVIWVTLLQGFRYQRVLFNSRSLLS
jgi:hypothetical protein